MAAKAFLPTRRTKVCADGTVRKIPGWHRDNGPYKSRDEMGKDAVRVVGQPNST
jgi:hypothetical protein